MLQDVKYVIITPVRDEEKHIEATIEAVADQTIRPTEWVLVDDGSSDGAGTSSISTQPSFHGSPSFTGQTAVFESLAVG